MTVDAATVLPTSHALNGVTTDWTFPGKLFEDDHIQVRIVDAAGVETLLTLDEGYTVLGVGEEQATVRLATAAGTSSKTLVLARVLPLERQTVIAPGPFPPEVVDNDLDRVVMQIQQLQEQISRAVLQQISTTARGLTLPLPPAIGAPENYIAWSDDRTALINRSVVADDVQNPDAKVTTRYPDDANLSTASGFDNTALLNPYLQGMSETGGGVFRLESANGASYDFPDGIIIPSLVSLEMASPLRIGPTASIRIQGDTATAFEGLRLVSDATLGGSTLVVDTAPLGGGAVSSFMKVGGSITISGLRAGSGTPIQSETNSITAINDGTRTITLSDPLNFAYEVVYPAGDYEEEFSTPNRTLINVHTCALLQVDNTLRADQVTVRAADVPLISAGDWVQIEDDRRTDASTTYIEIRQVLAVEEDGNDVITLNGQLRRIYLVSENARLTVLDPAFRATMSGGTVTFLGAADPTRIDPVFEITRAVDCYGFDCEVPNTDSVGRRGPMHRINRSYNSHFIRPAGRNPKFLGEGEGNGCIIAYSTRCSAQQPVYQGTRHGVQYVGATECAFEEVDLSDQRLTALDHHGLNSVGCYSTIRRISFSGRTASSSNIAVVFGNSAFPDGDHECVVMGGEITPFEGAGSVAGARFFPPSSNCYLIGVRGRSIEKFIIHRDVAGSDAITLNCGAINCSVDGATDYILDLQGGLSGSLVRTLQGFVFRDFVGTNLKRGFHLDQVEMKAILNVSLSFTAPDALHAVRMIDVPAPRVVGLLVEGCSEGIRLDTCPDGLWLKCDILDIALTEWLDDDGGNSGTEFAGCNAYTADGDPVTLDASGGSTITYKAVSNIGTESTAVYSFSATDKLLARVSVGSGAGEEVTFTDAAQALSAAATAVAQHDLLFGIGTNIASAATTNIAAATEVAVTVTGTTTITAFGTLARGIRVVTFAGALTLTHNGTSLILPGAANIQTAAGDVAVMQTLGSGNWRCLSYVRAASSLAIQPVNNVAITGGSITGIADLAIADGGTAASTAASARTNLGLDTMSQQAASAVAITGGTIAGATITGGTIASLGTDLAIADGGTAASTKQLARVTLSGGPTALTDAATIATDCSLNDSFTVTLGGNRTLGAPTNVVAGTHYFWAFKQDGTGSRTLALHANFIVADSETFAMKPEIASTTILAAYAETTSRLLVGFKKYA